MEGLHKNLFDKALVEVALPKAEVRQITLSELFCGAGGVAAGAYLSSYLNYSFSHLWATDYNKDACSTFKRNFPDTDILCKNIADVDFSKRRKTDGLVFGFPCNDFSNVGEQKGINGNFGGLYRYCIKALQVLQPVFFVAENVGGLRSSNGNKDYARILEEFAGCNYNVVPHYYKFEKYGLPQARHRIIIVGFHTSTGVIFEHKKPFGTFMTAKEALADIHKDVANNERPKQTKKVVERLKYIRPGENVFTADLPDELKLNVKSVKMSMIYRRLSPDKPSYTITGSGGGGTHVYHWSENRALTNRERARLQTFPDSFVFNGNKESVRKQIGMAVPPQGAKIVFTKILQTIHENNL